MPLSLKAYQILEEMANQEIDDTSFPTNFQVVIKLKNIIADPDVAFAKVASVISGEALTASKVLSYANSAAMHNLGQVTMVEKAISRIGLTTTRRIAMAVAMVQLSKTSEVLAFTNISRAIWLHSLYTSSAAYVLAKHFSTVNPEEAQFVGLMLNIGAFFFLYKAGSHPRLKEHEAEIRSAISKHHLKMTRRLIPALGLSEDYVEWLSIDSIKTLPPMSKPDDMRSIVQAANYLASEVYQFNTDDFYTNEASLKFADLRSEIEERYIKAHAEFR